MYVPNSLVPAHMLCTRYYVSISNNISASMIVVLSLYCPIFFIGVA